jgi:hypothetical protein
VADLADTILRLLPFSRQGVVITGCSGLDREEIFRLARETAEAVRAPGWRIERGRGDDHNLYFAIEDTVAGAVFRARARDGPTLFGVLAGDLGVGDDIPEDKRAVYVSLIEPAMRRVLGLPFSVLGFPAYRDFVECFRAAVEAADPAADLKQETV